jgi:hypothetical protein
MYEATHEGILGRLSEHDLPEYLADMLPLFEEFDTLTTEQARARFASLARKWMTDEERARFTVPALPIRVSVVCVDCGSMQMVLNEATAEYCCEKCGVTQTFIGPSSSRYLPYDHEEAPVSCPYKRSNHFQEWLNGFMAKQSCTIPEDVFTRIEAELKKYRIHDYSRLNSTILRGILKSLRLNKYYENIPFILYRLKGEEPPKLTPTVEHELRVMFNEVTPVFDRVVKRVAPNRRNFLSYSYTIYKLLQLLELDHLLHYFPLLKSREKLQTQDRIWKAICSELDWRFIPSV